MILRPPPGHHPAIHRPILSRAIAWLRPGRGRLLLPSLLLVAGLPLSADPLSRKTDIDFFHDVPSRDLHGLATRSDGRLVAGPALTELHGLAPAELLWCLEPAAPGRWLAGSGPGGRIWELSLNSAGDGYTSREVAKLDDAQVFAVKRLADGTVLAGTSPKGGLWLLRQGKAVARVGLPADSVFDLVAIDAHAVLAATGNPGRIYRIDLAKFAASGTTAERVSDRKGLADRGITLFGEIRDRNVRRIARLSDGRVVAGSSPRGNVYLFPAKGGAPFIVQENRDAEVSDLLPDGQGGFYAAVIYSAGELRLTPTSAKPREIAADLVLTVPPVAEKFGGRSALEWFPADGFPETLTVRSGVAFYRLARQGNLVLIAGGDQGEFSGFDLDSRLAVTFAGSGSAQLNGLEPIPGKPGRFLALRNNAAGLASIDFGGASVRSAETDRIDLGAPARLGALRFNRIREIDEQQISIEAATSNGTDEIEGWSPWTGLTDHDGGWQAPIQPGRYVKFRFKLPAAASSALELDKASIYYLNQDRRPQLQEFRMLAAGFAVVVPADSPSPVTTTIAQLLQSSDRDLDKRHSTFLSSQVVASPGTRVAFWTVSDADGDSLLYTFSIRRDGQAAWTDLAVDSPNPYVQFETSQLPEGTYFTRLVTKEGAPRPENERLTAAFETDDMVVDHTPPQIFELTAKRAGDNLVVAIHGRDALSLLDSAEFTFNNGVHEVVEQPADGILDGKEETFVLEEKAAHVSDATSVEVTLYDAAGNGATKRIGL